MPQFFSNKRLIILLISIIILVALIGFSIRDRDKLTWPEQFIKDSTGWVQTAISRPANYVSSFFENIRDLQNTYDENKQLKTRLSELAQLEAKVQALEADNKELNEILEKEPTLSDYKLVQANVIGRNPDRWHELLVINKGKQNGIKQNMAVITANGLIGKVKSTSQFTSTIQLLSANDPTNRISAQILGGATPYFGTIEGYDEEKELLKLKRIPYNAKVNKDQIVTTSGLGGVFPEGLPVGKVVEVVPDEFGLNQTAYVKPGADFYKIKHVMVVTVEMEQLDLSEVGEEEDL